MIVHYEEVELSKTLEIIVELERPTFSDIVAQPLVGWLLYSFLTRIFLQWEVQEKKYRKKNWEMKIMRFVDKVDTMDKEIKNLTRGR